MPPTVRNGVGEHPAGSDAEEVVFVSAGGLMSRVLINNISIQSTRSRGSTVLNLQVPQWPVGIDNYALARFMRCTDSVHDPQPCCLRCLHRTRISC